MDHPQKFKSDYYISIHLLFADYRQYCNPDIFINNKKLQRRFCFH